ncbi:unnamed protein product [Pseudo-nitzschia multistriata]|uniref:Uncharacterized protein n=1 Tax=Pseudo-nitzschia multistriata TaxID=183589 RepID=A0A448Z6D0_9STRA|nr:unnamed protein product [Pseudo-nitzschia multistriata]
MLQYSWYPATSFCSILPVVQAEIDARFFFVFPPVLVHLQRILSLGSIRSRRRNVLGLGKEFVDDVLGFFLSVLDRV